VSSRYVSRTSKVLYVVMLRVGNQGETREGAQTDERMEVNGDERRQSSDMETLHAPGPSTIQASPKLPDSAVLIEPPFAFRMA
jgi:hypothetical protein